MQPKLRDPSFVGALVYFDRVAELQSFTLAAEALGVTTSAVSHRVKRLEQTLGQRLFRREGGVVSLTEPGYRLRDATGSAFESLDLAVEHITGRRALRVSVGPYLSVAWLMPRLERFERRHPGLRVELVHQIGKPDLAQVDLAIWWTEPCAATAQARQLFSASMVPVASPTHRSDQPVWRQGLPPLHYRSRTAWLKWLERAGGPREFGLSGEVFEDPNITLEAAALGRGLAMGFAPFVDSHAYVDRLRPVSDIAVPSPANYYLLVRPDADDEEPFPRWLLEQARQAPGRAKRASTGLA